MTFRKDCMYNSRETDFPHNATHVFGDSLMRTLSHRNMNRHLNDLSWRCPWPKYSLYRLPRMLSHDSDQLFHIERDCQQFQWRWVSAEIISFPAGAAWQSVGIPSPFLRGGRKNTFRPEHTLFLKFVQASQASELGIIWRLFLFPWNHITLSNDFWCDTSRMLTLKLKTNNVAFVPKHMLFRTICVSVAAGLVTEYTLAMMSFSI